MDSGPDSGLRALLRDVGCGVLAVADARVEFVNTSLLTLFGAPDGSWQGAPAADLLDVLVPVLVDGTSFRASCSTGVYRPVTRDLSTSDGRTLECDFQPVGDRGYLVLVWDVSPDRAEETDRIRRQRAEIIAGRLGARAHRARADEAERTGERLAARNEELAATDAARVELLATASHELRTPLTSILSFSELLSDADADGDGGTADGRVAQYAEIVHRNARRLLDTVEDLLMLAGLGSAPRPASQEPVDLGSLVQQTVEDLGPASAAAGVEIALDLAPQLIVTGDTDELVRMVCNVVDNAVKYSEPGSRVDVGTAAAEDTQGGVARIVVRDRGTGIPADEVDSVFGQFFRSSTARASGRPGTGLGLAIAQGVAAHHGGTIALTSTIGEGTTVTMELPLAGSTS